MYRTFLPLIAATLLLTGWSHAQTDAKVKSVLDGAYTTAQAKRGQASYEAHCMSCHRADLGGFSGPPLKGDLFIDRWREFNLNVLFDAIRAAMPLGNPGSLDEKDYLDIVTYILQTNDLPAGAAELTAQTLKNTLLVGKNGPQPLPSSAQVEVVGCMTEDSGNGWFLTGASEPTRTLDAFQLAPEDLKSAKDKALGGLVFRLANLGDLAGFSTEGTIGSKMYAKGILVRQSNGDRINVTALRAVAASCAPDTTNAEKH
ncbi:MAG TPA: cytochrome c [Bryobacteraceae bacterium]|nr:cytochrome c [Bryobacteraceae bacterium]